MSGHETIRVLEVEVDVSLPSSAPDGKGDVKAEEEEAQPVGQPEVGGTQDGLTVPQSAGAVGKSWPYWLILVGRLLQKWMTRIAFKCQ